MTRKSSTPERKRPKQSRNDVLDHFISPTAFHLEEAHVHVFAIIHGLDFQDLPKEERVALRQVRKNLQVLMRREAKRRGHPRVYS